MEMNAWIRLSLSDDFTIVLEHVLENSSIAHGILFGELIHKMTLSDRIRETKNTSFILPLNVWANHMLLKDRLGLLVFNRITVSMHL